MNAVLLDVVETLADDVRAAARAAGHDSDDATLGLGGLMHLATRAAPVLPRRDLDGLAHFAYDWRERCIEAMRTEREARA